MDGLAPDRPRRQFPLPSARCIMGTQQDGPSHGYHGGEPVVETELKLRLWGFVHGHRQERGKNCVGFYWPVIGFSSLAVFIISIHRRIYLHTGNERLVHVSQLDTPN
jgi:hypothetical protein